MIRKKKKKRESLRRLNLLQLATILLCKISQWAMIPPCRTNRWAMILPCKTSP
jgi:hypothetical protein